MPTVRMNTDSSKPPRTAGKLYNIDNPEAGTLVRDGFADWEYVAESKVAALTSEDLAVKQTARTRGDRPPEE